MPTLVDRVELRYRGVVVPVLQITGLHLVNPVYLDRSRPVSSADRFRGLGSAAGHRMHQPPVVPARAGRNPAPAGLPAR